MIVVPQYPSPLRYQEWWPHRMREYGHYFEETVFLEPTVLGASVRLGEFSPTHTAIDYEMAQIRMYLDLEFSNDDVLLLCDLSFPGLFASVLYHHRPRHCFAVCHGTSRNRYDYFARDRHSKWGSESAVRRLFDAVFVATEYHRAKLGWSNCRVVRFLLPRIEQLGDVVPGSVGLHKIVSVARPCRQKVNHKLERDVTAALGIPIARFCDSGGRTWGDYYSFLAGAEFLLITSCEETYGYQVVDALSVGTTPIAPLAASYPELLPGNCLYTDVESATAIIRNGPVCPPVPLWGDTFIRDTAEIMLRSV